MSASVFLYDETSLWLPFLRKYVGEVEFETDYDTALDLMLSKEYDLAFINLYGSEPSQMKGLELLRTARLTENFTSVVVFTTDESNRFIREAYDAGCDWYFIKGMDSASEFSYLMDRYASPQMITARKRLRSIHKALVDESEPIPVLRFHDNPTVSYREKGDVLTLTEMSPEDKRLLDLFLIQFVRKNLDDITVREQISKLILSFLIRGDSAGIPSMTLFVDNDGDMLTDDFYANGIKLEVIEMFYETPLEKHIDFSGVRRLIKNSGHIIDRYMPVDVVLDESVARLTYDGDELLPVIVENSYDIRGYVPASQFCSPTDIPHKFRAVKKKYYYGEKRPENILILDLYELDK